MAIGVLTNLSIVINSVDLSDHATNVIVDEGVDAVENTAFGATFHTFMAGLKTARITGELFQDYASGKTDATMAAILAAGAAVNVVVKPVNDTAAPTNPKRTLSAILTKYTGVGGAVGAAHKTSFEFAAAGALVRAEA